MVLVMLKGFPGSGKSTLGRALSRQLGWALIDKDDIKDMFSAQILDADGLAYDVMLNIVRRQLLQGLNVICDSPLTYTMTYQRTQQIATETRASLVIVECFCSDELLWSQRVNARKQYGLPIHHMTDWERVQAYRCQHLADASYPITHPHLVVDTAKPLEVCLAVAIEWLERTSCS
ncbi:MAG: ATP-binding protein [Ktedonobacteraceae bacterium]